MPDLGNLDADGARALLVRGAIRAGKWDAQLPALALEIAARMHVIDAAERPEATQ